jgi:hypothetical protein
MIFVSMFLISFFLSFNWVCYRFCLQKNLWSDHNWVFNCGYYIANFHFCTYKFGSCAIEFIIRMGASRMGRRENMLLFWNRCIFIKIKFQFFFDTACSILFMCKLFFLRCVIFFLCRHNISNVSTFMMKTWNSCKKITSFICRSATSSSLF